MKSEISMVAVFDDIYAGKCFAGATIDQTGYLWRLIIVSRSIVSNPSADPVALIPS